MDLMKTGQHASINWIFELVVRFWPALCEQQKI